HELAALRDGADEADEGVDARVVGPDGSSRIRARWCIGADGASSTVRHLLGLPFEGVTDDATFCVADLHGATGMPDDRLSARFGKESFAIIFPLGSGGHARAQGEEDRKSTRLNSSHVSISYAVFCLKKKKMNTAVEYNTS